MQAGMHHNRYVSPFAWSTYTQWEMSRIAATIADYMCTCI